ncbi:hypothetical protein TraAM80_04757 [Trypanosoma rangeli]|uniref:Uncharacterized protein n=1 Tax=Trypanosoma rangeli TaxID=5698 RepID=A0A3R7KF07_TRYRA|nr:uncharacterized protein TraAM80_04757 [Trypanosoma rangeli]RNF05184.1 hypothetical protein TraAM80_04757 [Trypanosoma rangeli]|eukprot:RNF05184.1 hypothetical protein TraAM80_04757 [Trypanosoma rangeli]
MSMRRRDLREFLRGKEEENERARDAVLRSLQAEYEKLLASKLSALMWQVEHHRRRAASSQADSAAVTATSNVVSGEGVGSGASNVMAHCQCCKIAPRHCLCPEQNIRVLPPDLQQGDALVRHWLACDVASVNEAELFAEAEETRTREPLPVTSHPTTYSGQHGRTEVGASRMQVDDDAKEGDVANDANGIRASLFFGPLARETPTQTSSHTYVDPPPVTYTSYTAIATTTLARPPAPAVQLHKMPTEEAVKAHLRKKIASLYNDAEDMNRSQSRKAQRRNLIGLPEGW